MPRLGKHGFDLPASRVISPHSQPRSPDRDGFRRAVGIFVAALVAFAVCGFARPPTESPQDWVGKPLDVALAELERKGAPLIFSSALVPPSARVVIAPEGETLQELVRDLLRPHGLTLRLTPEGRWVVVRAPGGAALNGQVIDADTGRKVAGAKVRCAEQSTATSTDGRFRCRGLAAGEIRIQVTATGYRPLNAMVATGSIATTELLLTPLPVSHEEILVSSRGATRARERTLFVDGGAIAGEGLQRLPEAAGDPLRSAGLLPGASTRFGARPLIRGGTAEEAGVLLDGVELYEPYHLLDYGGLLSIVPASLIETVQIGSGNRDASYGDRLAGVVDLTSAEVSDGRRTEVELSPLQLAALGSWRRLGARSSWLGSARYGLLDRVARALEVADRPVFWDAFARFHWESTPRHRLSASALLATDDLDTTDGGDDALTSFSAHSASRYFWLVHDDVLSPRAFLTGSLSSAEVERRREWAETRSSTPAPSALFDRRRLVAPAWREDLVLVRGAKLTWQLGADLRHLDARYRYQGTLTAGGPLAGLRTNQTPFAVSFDNEVEGWQSAVYLQSELSLHPSFALVLGARAEAGDFWTTRRLSPRLHLVHQPTATTRWSLSWGIFTQARRPYELRVEDGETSLDRLEHADEVTLGLQQDFGQSWRLRVEAWDRRISRPQTRWVNLFDPLSLAPEAEDDRVRLAPSRSWSRGGQLSLSTRLSARLDGELTVGTFHSRDSLAEIAVRRESDRPYDLRLRLSFRPVNGWSLDALGRLQSGWPTTPLRLEDGAPVIGIPFSRRLPDHHQLDLQAQRDFDLGPGTLSLTLVVENIYDRQNVRGQSYEVVGTGTAAALEREERFWPGILPSVRLRWSW
jgi:hypothetical protein